MRTRARTGGFGQGCALCEPAGQPRPLLTLVVASGLRVAGAGLGVGIAGRRGVIGGFLQCGPRTEMAAESSCGEETAGMTPMKPRSWGLFREK